MYDTGDPALNALVPKIMRSSHTLMHRVFLIDLNHSLIGELSDRLTGGQIDVDSTADITHALKIGIWDGDYKMRIDTGSLDDGAMYLDRMIQVRYRAYSPLYDRMVDVPVFTGPITKAVRNGGVWDIECKGKEIFATAGLWKGMSYKKNTAKITIIRRVIDEVLGEAFLDLRDTNMKAKVPKEGSIAAGGNAWSTIVNLASSEGRQLFYNGHGRLVMRNRPSGVDFTYTSTNIEAAPSWGITDEGFADAVRVTGKKKRGKGKGNYQATAVLPRNNDLSAWSRSRDNRKGEEIPMYRPVEISNPNLNSDKECSDRAKKELAERANLSFEIAFNAYVDPRMEPGDKAKLNTSEVAGSVFSMRKYTIPLTPGLMAINYNKKMKPVSNLRPRARPSRNRNRRVA